MEAAVITDEESEAIRSVLQRHVGVRLVLLFGSQARDTAGAASDIDLAVDAPDADLLALAGELSATLGREVDVVSLDDPGVPLLEELLRDAVVVYESRPGEAAHWRAQVLTTLETDRPWFVRMRDAWLLHLATRQA
jgi:predicted nucleotidyltransferase